MALNLAYTRDAAYKGIFQDYIAGLQKLAEYKKWQTENKVVIAEMEKMSEALAAKYSSFVASKMAELDNQMTTIERRYKTTNYVYKDPQAEALRRQDFDLEFSTWDKEKVKSYLQDENRVFSRYELAKIKATYKDNLAIQNMVNNRVDNAEEGFARDPQYIFLAEQKTILVMTKGYGLGMVYLPADNDKGYEYLDLNLRDTQKSVQMIEMEIEKLTNLLANVTVADKPEWKQLRETDKSQKVQKLTYDEFDERIFRGAEGYDVTHRFKYLKERFTDGQTDMWDSTRDDYDPVAHLRHMEYLHDLKLKNDPNYSRRYHDAKKEAMVRKDEQRQTNP